MNLKVTVKPKEEEVVQVSELKPGTVFKFGNGVVALKLCIGKVLLLRFSNGENWFDIHDGSLNQYGATVLGHLVEIIVEK